MSVNSTKKQGDNHFPWSQTGCAVSVAYLPVRLFDLHEIKIKIRPISMEYVAVIPMFMGNSTKTVCQ